MTDTLLILAVLAAVSLLSAAIGAWFTAIPEISRKTIPFSGAVLAAIALFWVLPELASAFGWTAGLSALLAGALLIGIIDRFVYPICPTCSHTHNHDYCGTRLHGFASPLITAALLHSLFDGWAFVAGYTQNGTHGLAAGIAFHKVIEGFALGVILRAALRSRAAAFAWVAVTQVATLVGGALEMAAAEQLGAQWITLLLALGGGMFLYLGGHAMHSEWKRRSAERSAELS